MSVTNKAISIAALIMLIMAGFFLYQGINTIQAASRKSIMRTEGELDRIIDDVVKQTFEPYAKRIGSLGRLHPEIIRAFARHDRARLYELTYPSYLALKKENPFFHTMPFVLPDNTMFLRVHVPDDYGDSLKGIRPIMEEVNRTQEPRAGFEIGRHGAFYRTVQPLFFENRYIGAMELGIRVEAMLDALKDRLNTEVCQFYRTELWTKATGRKDLTRTFGPFQLLAHENSAFMELPPDISIYDDHREYIIDNRPMILHSHHSLKNFAGEAIGGIVMLQDISKETAEEHERITDYCIITLELLAFGIFILYFSFGRLIGRLEKEKAAQDRRLAELEDKEFHGQRND